MSDISCAIIASMGLTAILSFIQVMSDTKIRNVRYHLTFQFLLYIMIMLIGNVIATLAASSIIEQSVKKSPDSFFSKGPVWLWYSFVGVFGFEAIIQKINVTIFDKGVLTISDWITKAKNAAVSAALEIAVESNLMEKQSLADQYYSLFADKKDIHPAAITYLGNEKYDKIMTSIKDKLNFNVEKHLAYVMANEAVAVVKGAIRKKA